MDATASLVNDQVKHGILVAGAGYAAEMGQTCGFVNVPPMELARR